MERAGGKNGMGRMEMEGEYGEENEVECNDMEIKGEGYEGNNISSRMGEAGKPGFTE